MVKRDEQGRLVLVSVIDGEEVVTRVIPQHEEHLYLRRQGNNDFPAKAQGDKVQDMERPYDVYIHMEGGKVSRYDDPQRELPDHPECRKVETLREPLIKVNGDDASAVADYPLMGVNFDPGEDVEEEPVEEQK